MKRHELWCRDHHHDGPCSREAAELGARVAATRSLERSPDAVMPEPSGTAVPERTRGERFRRWVRWVLWGRR